MPKFVPPILSRIPTRLQRFLACALPLCALSLAAQQLALAQRPSNALPPPGEYDPGAAYPTATPYATATPRPEGTPRDYDPYAQGGPRPVPTATAQNDNFYDPYAQGTPTPTSTPRSQTFYAPDAQGTPKPSPDSLGDFLDGRTGPVSLKLSEAEGGWKSLRVLRSNAPRAQAPSRNSGNPDQVVWRAILENFGGEPDVFLTRGRTVTLNGEEHLAVYRAAFPSQDAALQWMAARADEMMPGGQRQQASWSQVQSIVRDFLDTVPVRSSLLNTRRIAGFDSIEEFSFGERFARFSARVEPEFRRSQPGASTRRVPVPPVPKPRSGGTPGLEQPVPQIAPQAIPVPDAVAQAASTEPLRRLFAAVQRYRADNADVLPPMEDLAQVQAALSIYLTQGESWRDPVSGRFFLPNARLSQRRMVHLRPFASSLILFYSEPDASGQRTVLRLDGIIRRVSPGEWDKLNGTSGVS